MHKHIETSCAVVLALSLSGVAAPVLALPMAGNSPNVLSFGVGNNPLGGIARIGDMPVGYRYQYFTGGLGVNDWRHWNTPDGAFADQWLNESREAGLMPVVTYYELVHAAPHAGEDPPFRNMQVDATMKAYFENWIFLLQRIAAFGEPVIVHLEPDMFGYVQSHNSDPAQTPVAVASSGLPQAAGYENNARGFAKLMVALRDQYAPKVILGWHVSNWATRTDLILNQGDPDQLALATAEFYRALGAPFDVMFAEFSDRDSGYYQQHGAPQRWWKPADFDTFRRFLSRLSTELGQEVILWQIPMGNTLYQSSNNTIGHYQDNRPEYFLQPLLENGDTGRLAQYRDAGVVAFLFGAGQDDQTKYFDARGDDVTNPDPIDNRLYNHSDHLNDRPALNADDDGGFLRLGINTYYANGALPLLARAPVACNDGKDNDGDGLVDYPADPGCASSGDTTETQPLPACADGADNDQDGFIDYPDDPGCTDADDGNEFNPAPPVELPAQLSVTADWGSGYCADVAVANNSGDSVEWQTHFTVQGSIGSFWNAVYSQSGDQVRVTGADWNKILASGASANFGFCAQRPVQVPKAACADGLDNDGDGLSDYPADPGCTASDDNEEANGAAGLESVLKIDSDWQSGYCATVTVKNTGATAQIWDVNLTVEGRVNNLWNAIYSQTGGTLNAKGYDWNKSVPAGGNVSFGFCATR